MLTDFRKLLDAVAARAGWKAGELGHGTEALVERIYGHVGTVRHRAKVVEYRVEQDKKILKEQLAALRVGAGRH